MKKRRAVRRETSGRYFIVSWNKESHQCFSGQVDCNEHRFLCSSIVFMIHSKVNDEFAQNAVFFLLLCNFRSDLSSLRVMSCISHTILIHHPPPTWWVFNNVLLVPTLGLRSTPSLTWSESRMDQTYFSVNPRTGDNVNNYFSSTCSFFYRVRQLKLFSSANKNDMISLSDHYNPPTSIEGD
jgi:hypothetical protein